MTGPGAARAFAAAALLAGGGIAQAVAGDVGTRLHAAWLRETLDLDTKGAVAEYEAVAADRSGRAERWIAVARLAELQRQGVAVGNPGPVAEAPAAVRAALALVTPLPIAELLKEPAAGAESARALDLRPATIATLNWVRSQSGPNANERQRQRAASGRPRTPADRNDAERMARLHAFDVAQRELQGKTEQAAGLRAVYFPDWKQPALAGEPAAALARAKDRLDAWQKEPGSSEGQLALLGRLRSELDARGADAGAAIAWLGRMPVYADRLLAPPNPDGR